MMSWVRYVFRLSSTVIKDEEVNRVDVWHDGRIMFTRPFIYQSPCLIDMKNFPFDIQTCSLRFGSWMYTKEELDMVCTFWSVFQSINQLINQPIFQHYENETNDRHVKFHQAISQSINRSICNLQWMQFPFIMKTPIELINISLSINQFSSNMRNTWTLKSTLEVSPANQSINHFSSIMKMTLTPPSTRAVISANQLLNQSINLSINRSSN